MNDWFKITITSGLTVVVGALVFALQRFLLEPLHEQRKVIGRIAFALHFEGPQLNTVLRTKDTHESTIKRSHDASIRFRELGAALAETSQAIRCYRLWSLLRLAPKLKDIHIAIGLLTRLSNSLITNDASFLRELVNQNWEDDPALRAALGIRKWGM